MLIVRLSMMRVVEGPSRLWSIVAGLKWILVDINSVPLGASFASKFGWIFVLFSREKISG